MLGIWHVSFTVGNLARAVGFYRDVLGLCLVHEQVQDNEYTRRLVGVPGAVLRVAQLQLPAVEAGSSGHHLELVEYVTPQATRGDPAIFRPGAAHLAFVVRDIVSEHARLCTLGVHFISPPNLIEHGVNRGGYTCYFRDLDEITLELVQPPPRAGTQ